MIKSPPGIILVLFLIEAAILFLSSYRYTQTAFKYFPSMFWIYFVPMLANTIGLIPKENFPPWLSWIRYVPTRGCFY
ncbi:MAG: hypothetical protein ABFD82_15585 [Syntrophaceae bacterium]